MPTFQTNELNIDFIDYQAYDGRGARSRLLRPWRVCDVGMPQGTVLMAVRGYSEAVIKEYP